MSDFKTDDIVEITSNGVWKGSRYKVTAINTSAYSGETTVSGILTFISPSLSEGTNMRPGDSTCFYVYSVKLAVADLPIKVGDHVEVTHKGYLGIQMTIAKIYENRNTADGVITYSPMASYKIGHSLCFYLKDLKITKSSKPLKILSDKGWGPV